MRVDIKRVYDPASPEDGRRFLVDRLWPRGVKKEALTITAWLKEAAPSAALRRWFGHDPARWEAFRLRYRSELESNRQALVPLLQALAAGTVTLVYSARSATQNQAVVLREFLRDMRP